MARRSSSPQEKRPIFQRNIAAAQDPTSSPKRLAMLARSRRESLRRLASCPG